MLKYFGLIFTLICTSLSSLYAANGDVFILFDVPAPTKQRLFTEIVEKSVPYKTMPDRYHVTLTHIPTVAPQHQGALKSYLQNVAKQYKPQAHFTPVSAANFAGLTVVLTPTAEDKKHFQRVNSALYTAVQQFNLQHNTSYNVGHYGLPQNYEPHVTLIKSKDMRHNGLNPQNVIQTVNLNLASYKNAHGTTLDLMQVVQPKSNKPPVTKKPVVTKQSVVQVNKKPVVTKQPVVQVNKKPVVTKQPVVQVNKKPVVRKRPIVRANNKAVVRKKSTARLNKKSNVRKKSTARVNKKANVRKKSTARVNKKATAKKRSVARMKKTSASRGKRAVAPLSIRKR